MKIFFPACIMLPLLVISCAPDKPALGVCDLVRSDFIDRIDLAGSIQAVNTVNIMAPMNFYGLMAVSWVIPEGSVVEQGDTLCILDCNGIQQMLDQEKKSLESLQADLKKAEADNNLKMALLDARVKENKAGMAISQLDSVQIRFAPRVRQQIMQLELEKARVEEKKLQKKYEAEKRISEAGIRQIRSQIAQAENKMKMMEDQVGSMTIKAPKSGIVTEPDSHGSMMVMFGDGNVMEMGGYPKVGKEIFPEMALMALPDMSEMQISVQVQEVDFKRIEKGQKVNITVDAVSGLRTTGSVKRKSLTAKTTYIGESKLNLYEVIVGVDSCHSLMPPGLSAQCSISINEVRDTIVVPSMAVFDRDSTKIVYVASGDRYQPVTVETGLSNSSKTIITNGLTGNETICLVEPPRNLILKPKKI